MNYLAHLLLADCDNPPASAEFLIGNLLGDFVTGRLDQQRCDELGPARARGIELHRSIDGFTDRHPLVKISKRRLSPPWRRFGGIVIDLFYDHFLARCWASYCAKDFDVFCGEVYVLLQNHYHSLPANAQRSVAYLLSSDLLRTYRQIDGIECALAGIERRFSRPTRLRDASIDLHQHYTDFERDFTLFFPQLIAFSKRRKTTLTGWDP